MKNECFFDRLKINMLLKNIGYIIFSCFKKTFVIIFLLFLVVICSLSLF